MKTRILFFDDEPETSKQIRELLAESGYIVKTPKTVEEAFQEINMNGAELLIHSAHRTKTYWTLCDQIFAQYPEFPSLHFATGEISEMYAAKLKGPFHQKMRPLVPARDLLKRIRKLVFLGRLARQNNDLKRGMELHSRIDKVLEVQDLLEMKANAVKFFATEFKAKNAFFLSTGSFGYFLQEMWKVASINTGVEKANAEKHILTSAHPSSDQELSQYMNEVADLLPSGWELRQQRTYISTDGQRPKQKHSFCFIPLCGTQSKKVLGHLMLVDPLLYGDGGLEQVYSHLTKVMGRHLEQVLNYATARSLSYVDDLTELYNQRYLRLVLDKEISRAGRSSEPFSVLFMDIDHFKRVNDTRGHLIGSRVLVELSKILLQHIRTTDYGFRYGGDEFILILVGAESDRALAIAERIRKQVEASTFDVEDVKVQVTLSIGIATFPDHATNREQIIELADRAMYCGKNKSRNVVYVAS